MAEITLVAEAGRPTGSASVQRRLRAAGRIPAVVYGHGMDPLAVSVDGRDLRSALSDRVGLNAAAVPRGRRHQPPDPGPRDRSATRSATPSIHVDFQIVRRDEIVTADVPVILVGEAQQVAMNAGRRRAAAHQPHRPGRPGPHPELDRGRHQRAGHRRHHPGRRPAAARGRHDRRRPRRGRASSPRARPSAAQVAAEARRAEPPARRTRRPVAAGRARPRRLEPAQPAAIGHARRPARRRARQPGASVRGHPPQRRAPRWSRCWPGATANASGRPSGSAPSSPR